MTPATSYFKSPYLDDLGARPIGGIFPFVEGDRASTQQAWDGATAMLAHTEAKYIKPAGHVWEVSAFRRPTIPGPWAFVSVVGERPGPVVASSDSDDDEAA